MHVSVHVSKLPLNKLTLNKLILNKLTLNKLTKASQPMYVGMCLCM